MVPSLPAQITTAKITGTVADQTGAVIPHASITLTNNNTGVVQTASSNSDGIYVFEAVPPGTYTIRSTSKGFDQYVGTGIQLHVQDSLTINVTLRPGTSTQRIVVTGAEPQLQTGNASVGQVVDTRAVNDLPLNGRNWASLAQLSAGVSTPAGAAPGSAIFVVDGTHFGQNDYRLDGIDDNVEVYGGTAFGTDAAVTPPPDAIQEFRLQNGDYSAEFGHSAGGIVNALVKTGTNVVHGDVWEYIRNNDFDANDYFSKQFHQPIPGYHQNQFGGTIGGPVYISRLYNGRNRTFFFADYQGTRINEAAGTTSSIPTAAMQSSDFTNLRDLINGNSGTRTDALGRIFPLGTVFDPATTRSVGPNAVDPVTGLVNPSSNTIYVRDPLYTGGSVAGISDYTTLVQYLNQIPPSRMDPNALKLLQLYPAPNGPGLISNYHNNAPEQQNTNQFDVRVDENISPSDILFAVFDWDHIQWNIPPSLPGIADGQNFEAGLTDGPHYASALGYTHVFTPTLTNELHLGYNHTIENINAPEGDTMGIPAAYGIQGIPQISGNGGLPTISIGGLSGLGVSGYEPTIATMWDFEAVDNVTKVSGRHTLESGYQFDSVEGDLTQPPNSRGAFDYSGQYTDIPNAGSGTTGAADLLIAPGPTTVPNGISEVGGVTNFQGSNYARSDDHRYYMGAYFQDDIKATRDLTLNLGLRWDHVTPLAEKSGDQANMVQGDGGNGPTGTYYIPRQGCDVGRAPAFDQLLQSSGIQLVCSPGLTVQRTQNYNFSPRLGFAYSVVPQLVVRGGYGLVYGALEDVGSAPQILGDNYPFLYVFNAQSPNSYMPLQLPDGATATMENTFAQYEIQSATNVAPAGLSLSGAQYKMRIPYVETYNLTVQYQVASHDAVQIGYVGNVGRHLDSFGTHNDPSEILPPGANIYQYVPFPNFAPQTTYVSYNAESSYNSMQATYQRNFDEGLQLLANYTYSKCLGDEDLNTGDFGSPPSFRAQWLPGFGIRRDYAACVADSTHIVHVSGLYQLPFGRNRRWLKGSGRMLNAMAGGWSVNFIYTFQSGEPFTVGCPIPTTADFGCDADLVPEQNPYAGPHDQEQWLNPNAFTNPPVATTVGQSGYAPLGSAPQQVRGPGFNNVDFSLFKEFRLYERSRLQFRAEAFNLANHPEFGQPTNLDFTNQTDFSQITTLVNTPRLLQFAVKVLF
jgi:hypothetical protein